LDAKRLLIVAKIRRIALQEAQQAVADCLAEEALAEALARSWEQKIWRETEAVAALDGTDQGALVFARWLAEARHKLVAARASYDGSMAKTTASRAELALARRAVSVAEDLWLRAQAIEQQHAEKRSQAELDEGMRSRM